MIRNLRKEKKSLNLVYFRFLLQPKGGGYGQGQALAIGWGESRRDGPSPSLDWPTPPHSLHNLTIPHRGRPASCADLLYCRTLPDSICHTCPCLYLLATSLNLTMCARTISVEVFARTALQAAALPGTAFVQPGHLLVVY